MKMVLTIQAWCSFFTNLIVSSEIGVFLFFTQENYVNNKVYYRKIMSPLNYITT